jgi:hypothetical protein
MVTAWLAKNYCAARKSELFTPPEHYIRSLPGVHHD